MTQNDAAKQPARAPVSAGSPPDAAANVGEFFVPYKNGSALASYYLGLFSIFPLLGAGLGIAAVILGIKGLRRAKQYPQARGKAHAWVGLITGTLFGLFNLALLTVIVVGLVVRLMGRP